MHRPKYKFTVDSHWCICTCGWRSILASTRAEIEAAFKSHKESS